MNYELDSNEARKADQRGAFINETGKYIGRFVRAEEVISEKGTKGIDFSLAYTLNPADLIKRKLNPVPQFFL